MTSGAKTAHLLIHAEQHVEPETDPNNLIFIYFKKYRLDIILWF